MLSIMIRMDRTSETVSKLPLLNVFFINVAMAKVSLHSNRKLKVRQYMYNYFTLDMEVMDAISPWGKGLNFPWLTISTGFLPGPNSPEACLFPWVKRASRGTQTAVREALEHGWRLHSLLLPWKLRSKGGGDMSPWKELSNWLRAHKKELKAGVWACVSFLQPHSW